MKCYCYFLSNDYETLIDFTKNLYNYKMNMSSKLLSILLLVTYSCSLCLLNSSTLHIPTADIMQSKCTFLLMSHHVYISSFSLLWLFIIHYTGSIFHSKYIFIFKMWHMEVLFNAGWKKGHDDVIYLKVWEIY
jgi:hypothetical protein